MMPYRVVTRRASADDLEYYLELKEVSTREVLVADDGPRSTGLLDQNGREIVRVRECIPLGFVGRRR